MSNPAKRAASNHTPCSNVAFGSLMTTSGAAGSLVRNAPISPTQAASLWRRRHLPLQAQCRLVQGAGAALQDCFVETDGVTRLPTATRIDRVGAQDPDRERTAAQREVTTNYRRPVNQQNQHVSNGEEC
jgi:hypothetical protein